MLLGDMCGIYCIENLVNHKMYIGQSKNIKERWKDHKKRLRTGKHSNHHLQRAWIKYGDNNFVFYVIELCEKKDLDVREIYWIDKLNTYKGFGYNSSPGGDVSGGVPSEEGIRRLSEMWRGEKGPLNKYSEYLVLTVISYLSAGVPRSYISEATGVSKATVSDIKNHRTWKHLTFWMEFPDSPSV